MKAAAAAAAVAANRFNYVNVDLFFVYANTYTRC